MKAKLVPARWDIHESRLFATLLVNGGMARKMISLVWVNFDRNRNAFFEFDENGQRSGIAYDTLEIGMRAVEADLGIVEATEV